jgi:hypothetical protein
MVQDDDVRRHSDLSRAGGNWSPVIPAIELYLGVKSSLAT